MNSRSEKNECEVALELAPGRHARVVFIHDGEDPRIVHLAIGSRNIAAQCVLKVYSGIILHAPDDVGCVDARGVTVVWITRHRHARNAIGVLIRLPGGRVDVGGVRLMTVFEAVMRRVVFTTGIARRSTRNMDSWEGFGRQDGSRCRD